MTDLGSLNIKFTLDGVEKVIQALNTLESRLEAMGKTAHEVNREQQTDLASLTARMNIEEQKRTREAKSELDKRKRDYDSLYSEIDRINAQSVSATEQAEKQKTAIVAREVRRQSTLRQAAAAGLRRGGTMLGMMAGGAISAFGGEMLNDAWQNRKSTADMAATLEMMTRGGANLNAKEEMQAALTRGGQLGLTGEQMLSGRAELAKRLPLGRSDLVKSSLIGETMAKAGAAYQMKSEDLAKAASQFVNDTGGNANEQQVNQFLLNAIAQTKHGMIPLSDVAGHMGKVMALAQTTIGTPEMQMAEAQKLMGLEQIAAQGGRITAGTAQTSVARTFGRLESMSDKQLKKLGLAKSDIYADPKHTLPADQILANVIGKTHGNLQQVENVFGPIGMGLATPLVNKYNQAEAAQKGSGRQAIFDMTHSATAQKGNTSDLEEDFKTRQDANKIQTDLVQAEDKLALSINDHYPALESAMGKLMDVESNLPTALATTLLGAPIGTGLGTAFGTAAGNMILQGGTSLAAWGKVGATIGLAAANVAIWSQVYDQLRKLIHEWDSKSLDTHQTLIDDAVKHGDPTKNPMLSGMDKMEVAFRQSGDSSWEAKIKATIFSIFTDMLNDKKPVVPASGPRLADQHTDKPGG